MNPIEVPAPHDTDTDPALGKPDFQDCFEATVATRGRGALELALSTFARTPRWVNAAMALRNRVVRFVGLKDLGLLSGVDPARGADSYRVGDRVGIFTIVAMSHAEVVFGDSDRHLQVRVHVRLSRERPGIVSVTTVVHIRNLLGRLYMAAVVPMHKRIVPAMLARVA